MRSHSHPMSSRATTVIDTDPMTSQPICDCVRAISSRTTFMSGAMPNHAKKHRKNANHVMWNARIWGVDTLNSRMRVALLVTSTCRLRSCQPPRDARWEQRASAARADCACAEASNPRPRA